MRISTLAAIAALTGKPGGFVVRFHLPLSSTVHGNDQQNKERLLQKACIRNPRLPFCDTSPVETQPAEPEVDRRAEFLRQDERTLLTAERHQRPQQVRTITAKIKAT
ncbi:hypothetical protein QR680_000676 [Steinernema hermaphroditum]|uniref:Uncharacterized protein n=1 Tax=Steinernema hermaphroditum TaxID=289476 RepID=A0AA39LEH4_9BILA|nr:hypothetical protein QR680_000676 [Steinernema hermaphroditum]